MIVEKREIYFSFLKISAARHLMNETMWCAGAISAPSCGVAI